MQAGLRNQKYYYYGLIVLRNKLIPHIITHLVASEFKPVWLVKVYAPKRTKESDSVP